MKLAPKRIHFILNILFFAIKSSQGNLTTNTRSHNKEINLLSSSHTFIFCTLIHKFQNNKISKSYNVYLPSELNFFTFSNFSEASDEVSFSLESLFEPDFSCREKVADEKPLISL